MNELIAMWTARAEQENNHEVALAIMQCVGELKNFRVPSEEAFTRRALAKICANRDIMFTWDDEGFNFTMDNKSFEIGNDQDHLVLMAYDAVKNQQPEQIAELFRLCGVKSEYDKFLDAIDNSGYARTTSGGIDSQGRFHVITMHKATRHINNQYAFIVRPDDTGLMATILEQLEKLERGINL